MAGIKRKQTFGIIDFPGLTDKKQKDLVFCPDCSHVGVTSVLYELLL